MWWEAGHSISPTRVKGVFQEFSLWTIGHLNREWGVAWILFLHFQYFALIRWPWRNLPYPFRALSLITFILHRHIFVRQWDKKKQTERMGSSFFPPISGRSVSKRGTWVDGQDLFIFAKYWWRLEFSNFDINIHNIRRGTNCSFLLLN